MTTKTTVILLLSAAWAGGLQAQPAAPAAATAEGEASFGEAIVVTATRDERALDELPVSVTVLGPQEIAGAPAATTDELLRTVPGVNLPLANSTVASPFESFVSLRGLGGGRALVLVDGQPLNDAFFGFVPWDRIPADDLRQVEVVRGGSSSLFGSYAMGGVINLLTRPVEERDLQLRALGGSHATYRLHLHAGDRAGERFGWSLGLNRFDTDGYFTLEPAARGAIDVPSRSQATNARLRVEGQPAPGLQWFARVGAFDQDGQGGTRLSRDSREALDLALGTRSTVAGGRLDATLSYQDQEFAADNVDVPFFGGRDSEYVSNAHVTPAEDAGASLVWSRPFRSLLRSLVAGVDLRRIEGEDRARNFAPSGALVLRETGGGRQTSGGLFAETSLVPARSLEILLSARYDRWENADGRRVTAPGGTERFPARTADEINPRLALRWQAAPAVALRAAAYRAFRAPNLDELYRSSSLTGSALVANPFLDPEILTGYETGCDLLLGNVRAQVNLFRNDLEDEITFVATAFFPVFVLEVQNVGESRSEGVESLVEVDLGSGFRLDGSYTYTRTEVLANPRNPALVGKRRVGVPEDQAALSLRYRHPQAGWSVMVRGRASGARYTDLFNTATLDAHEVVDLSLSVPVGGHVELFGLAENLLDEEYPVGNFGGRVLGAPRQLFAGVRYSLR